MFPVKKQAFTGGVSKAGLRALRSTASQTAAGSWSDNSCSTRADLRQMTAWGAFLKFPPDGPGAVDPDLPVDTVRGIVG